MSLIGLIGGVSPQSTKIYYQLLNQHARQTLGGQHSAHAMFYMLDYGVMLDHYKAENWAKFNEEVVAGAIALKAGGASAIAITSGTTHVAAEAVANATGLPVIHMLDSLSDAMTAKASTRPLLLGTPLVMSDGFFQTELRKRFCGDVITPDEADRDLVRRVIFDELVDGIVKDTSRAEMIDLVARYAGKGADGIILGCTELCMILKQDDCDRPVFSTTHIHAAAIAAMMR